MSAARGRRGRVRRRARPDAAAGAARTVVAREGAGPARTAPPERYSTASQQRTFFDDLVQRLRTRPDVSRGHPRRRAAALGHVQRGRDESAVGTRPDDPDQFLAVAWTVGGPDFFSTLRIPVLEGRAITADDRGQRRRYPELPPQAAHHLAASSAGTVLAMMPGNSGRLRSPPVQGGHQPAGAPPRIREDHGHARGLRGAALPVPRPPITGGEPRSDGCRRVRASGLRRITLPRAVLPSD
jgi:hypothetical protein